MKQYLKIKTEITMPYLISSFNKFYIDSNGCSLWTKELCFISNSIQKRD